MKALFITISACVAITVALKDWEDPHDMNTNAKTKYISSPSLDSPSAMLVDRKMSRSNDIQSPICLSNMKRIVAVIVKSAHIDKTNQELYQGHIRFTVNPEDYQFLMNFGKEDVTVEALTRLNTIFSEDFKRSNIEEYLDNIKSFQLLLYSAVVNIENLWFLGTIFMLYFVYQMFKNGFSFGYMLKYVSFMVIIADFGFRYRHLLQEAEEHNLEVVYSSKCDTNKMSWTEWTKFFFGSEECEKRIVTPLDPLLYQIKHLIIIPMHAVGTGMGGFGSNMFSSMPFPLNLIMWPIMLIFSVLCLLVILTVGTGRTLEFNIFHVIKLKLGDVGQTDNSLTSSNWRMLLDNILHRPMVHNVHISLPTSQCADNNSNEGRVSEVVLDDPKPHIAAKDADTSSNNSRKTVSTNTCYVPNWGSTSQRNEMPQDSGEIELSSMVDTNITEGDGRVESVNIVTVTPSIIKYPSSENLSTATIVTKDSNSIHKNSCIEAVLDQPSSTKSAISDDEPSPKATLTKRLSSSFNTRMNDEHVELLTI